MCSGLHTAIRASRGRQERCKESTPADGFALLDALMLVGGGELHPVQRLGRKVDPIQDVCALPCTCMHLFDHRAK